MDDSSSPENSSCLHETLSHCITKPSRFQLVDARTSVHSGKIQQN